LHRLSMTMKWALRMCCAERLKRYHYPKVMRLLKRNT
jgi:glutamyl-tRNA synthetase